MGVRVAVAGASGYAGGELLRLIAAHPDLELGPVTGHASVGAAVTDLHPHLASLAGLTFEPTEPARLATADLVFLALQPEESAAIAARLPDGAAVIDLSASFRLADPADWAAFYGGPHAGRWVYGLPELPGARDRIRAARQVAAPGCHATAVILALAPLLAAGLADPADIVAVAASGTSGAGRSPRPGLLATEVLGAVSAYQVGGVHRHTPEIEQALGEVTGTRPTVSFTPLLVPMPRGILATCTARLAGRPVSANSVSANSASANSVAADPRAVLADAYAGEPFIRVLPDGQWPSTAATLGGNAVHLQAAADAHAGRAVVVAAEDNLVKGAAGQAIQIANLMLGLPEGAGLAVNGVAPLGEGGQDAEQGAGDAGVGLAVAAGGAAGCSGQAGVQDGGVGVAAVAHAGQPGGEAPGTEPVGAVLGVEAGQERQADRGVDLGEQAGCAGEGIAQVGAELVRDGDAVADEVLAGAAGAAQRNGRGGVRGQGRQPGPVGAQRVGQDERVEPVVLVPGRPVAATQVLDLVRADHHHRDPRAEQDVDDRAVGALDRGFPGTGAGQDAGQLAQAGCAVLDRVPADLAATGIHDRHGVIIAGPVDASGHAAGWFFGKGSSGRLQACLLAARPSGEAPSCGAGTRLPVRSLFGARRRSALSRSARPG